MKSAWCTSFTFLIFTTYWSKNKFTIIYWIKPILWVLKSPLHCSFFFFFRSSSWTTLVRSLRATLPCWTVTLLTLPASLRSLRRRLTVVLARSLKTTPRTWNLEMLPSSLWSLENLCVWRAFLSTHHWVSSLIEDACYSQIAAISTHLNYLFQVVLLCVIWGRPLLLVSSKLLTRKPLQLARWPSLLRRLQKANESVHQTPKACVERPILQCLRTWTCILRTG